MPHRDTGRDHGDADHRSDDPGIGSDRRRGDPRRDGPARRRPRGDDAAFLALVDRYHPALVRLATLFVPDRSAAEEVARETWRALLRETDAPRAHAGLKARLFGLVVGRACRHGDAPGPAGPFARLTRHAFAADEPDIAPERFHPAGGESGFHWASPPADWGAMLDERLATPETRDRIAAAIGALPLGQRAVITLRDVEGCRPRRSAPSWGCPRRSNGRCCTGRGRASGAPSNGTSRRRRSAIGRSPE